MSNDEDLVMAAAPTTEVKAAAAFTALTGLFVALTGVQVVSVHWRDEWMNAMPYVFLSGGPLLLLLAHRTYRGGAKANVGAFALTTFFALGTCGWFLFTWGSVLSIMNMAAIAFSILGSLFCALAMRHTRRMAEARERLADEGMSLGF
jgi:hypothetical protein